LGVSSYGVLAARVMLAVVFLYSGQDKLRHWGASIDEVAKMGLPVPAAFAAATILTQLLGGLSVATGIGAPVGAALLAFFTIVATLLGHRFWLLRGEVARHELTTSLEHLAIVGGLLLVIAPAL
jgi:uncharacterized membrane protein YphA (DoxX/SURF4 family)